MLECNICKTKVPDSGMKLFITHRLISVMGDKTNGDHAMNGSIRQQVRLCEKCRKLNDLEIELWTKPIITPSRPRVTNTE